MIVRYPAVTMPQHLLDDALLDVAVQGGGGGLVQVVEASPDTQLVLGLAEHLGDGMFLAPNGVFSGFFQKFWVLWR